jgi:uncharacterized protein YvpB
MLRPNNFTRFSGKTLSWYGKTHGTILKWKISAGIIVLFQRQAEGEEKFIMKRWLITRLLVAGLWVGTACFWLSSFTTVQAQSLPEKVVLDKFPIFAQWYNLSCEYSATRMITAFYGKEINDTEFINLIPFHPNPHVGFRGDINGYFGGTGNYGIYAEPIAKALEEKGFKTKLLVNGPQSLKEELALGRPVQVWVIAGMGWGSPYMAEYEGLNFKLAGGEHSIVIYGYDNDGVYVADPGYGTQDYYSWGTFLRSWSYFDYMAMSVWLPGDNDTAGPLGVSPLFYRFWLNNGGLRLFGFPVSAASTSEGKSVQYFERVRLEYNLEGPYNQPIGIGLLGRELTQERQNATPFQPVANPDQPDVFYFDNTGHTLSGEFRTFWVNNGGITFFGFPISEVFTENGKQVQYFERARFEYEEGTPPDQIQLGRLGAEFLNRKPFIPAVDEEL